MHLPYFVKEDLDGFFGLVIDNLIQLLLIASLCSQVCAFPDELTYGRILPAAALSIFFGNIFYAWQARRLAQKEGRSNVCALPYGINTVSLFAFIFFVILPVYQQTKDATLAWRVGLLACFLSALIEILGSFVAPWIKKITPRAALLSALAGIAITFIAMDFAFKTFNSPWIAMIPLFIILLSYFSKIKLPFALPGGLYALAAGTALAWGGGFMSTKELGESFAQIQLTLPGLALGDLLDVIMSPYFYSFFSVILPMGLFNIVGSLQNIESAEAAGDTYSVRPSMLANGLGSLVAASFGSCFPTTIYIGHPAWKEMGARSAYSVMNGFLMLIICWTGSVAFLSKLIPMEAGIAIVLWIGLIIMAQAYQATPRSHAPAVALGLVPAMAAWAALLIQASFFVAGFSLEKLGFSGWIQSYPLKGILSLSQGFILSSMIWSAIAVFLIEKKFFQASLWSLMAGLLSFMGVIHVFDISGNDILNRFGWGVGFDFAVLYFLGAILFFGAHLKYK